MIGTTLEAKDLLEDFEVRRLELGAAFCAEGSRNTTLQQGLNHLGVRTFRLSAAVVLWYSSGPNHIQHARISEHIIQPVTDCRRKQWHTVL